MYIVNWVFTISIQEVSKMPYFFHIVSAELVILLVSLEVSQEEIVFQLTTE